MAVRSRVKGLYDCIHEIPELDYTVDLEKIDVLALILHGDGDQIVPIGAPSAMTAKIVKGAKLKVYPGAPHGMATTQQDEVNGDLLAFLKA